MSDSYLTLDLAKQRFAEGNLHSCDITYEQESGLSYVMLFPNKDDHIFLASARNPYETKEFKTIEGAISAAWKIGFREVSVMMS